MNAKQKRNQKKKGRVKSRPKSHVIPWTPLRPAVALGGVDRQPIFQENTTVWMNDRYTVHVTCMEPEKGNAGSLHLSIRDKWRSARHDWRDYQRIKNELAGPEREAMELYPRESRVVDTSNQFHLWVMPEGFDVPIGWDQGRVVLDEGESPSEEALREAAESMGLDPERVITNISNAKQRKLEEESA